VLSEAIRCHQAGRLADAERLYRQVLAEESRCADARHLLGVIALQRGQYGLAVERIGAAIGLDGTVALYRSNFGNALKAVGRLDDAVAAYHHAICLKPDYPQAICNLGAALQGLQRNHAAVAAFRSAIRINPDLAEAYSNMGHAMAELGQGDGAATACRTALCLRPDFAEANYNLATALRVQGRLADAVASYLAAVRIGSGSAEVLCDLGTNLLEMNQIDGAIAAFRKALCVKPDHAEARYNSAIAHLLLGDLAAGWRDFEWRWRGGIRGLVSRVFAQPQWGGEELGGRTVLLHAEQGMGDTIQFCRYAALVAERGGRVVLEAPRSMARLLTGLTGVDRLIAAGDPLPAFDLHCPLMSLPGLFGTTIERVPAPVPYLRAEAAAVARWRAWLGPSGFKIGIAWQGNPAAAAERGRSAPLACFAPLAAVPGVRLISLQKIHGLDQLDHCPSGMVVETLGADFDDGPDAFVDTAAVMMSLDLVITVDTAIGHLAGALDRPVWLALQAVPHWVWMLERDDSPWYPSVRLFRQRERGQWDEVFRRMAAALPVVRSERME
jgi:tetratricopeptide (TPR) repeat protein